MKKVDEEREGRRKGRSQGRKKGRGKEKGGGMDRLRERNCWRNS